MSTDQKVIVEATLYWPNLSRVNDMSGKFQVDLGNLKKNDIKALQDIGLEIKTDVPKEPKEGREKIDRGQFITCKSNYPIKVLFAAGVEVVKTDVIGNGTVARVKLGSYDWTFKNKKGTSAAIDKVQVTSLSKYATEEDPDFEGSTAAPVDDLNDSLDDMFKDE
jgi:hypothetical protein